MTKLALYGAAVVLAVTLYLVAVGVFVAPKMKRPVAPMLQVFRWEGCYYMDRRWICAV